MQRDTIRWLTAGLGTILALILASTVVQGGYTPPSQSGSLLDEVFAFVGDFGSWNTRHDNLPVEFLEMTPSAEQGNAVVLLLWLWLHDLGMGPTEQSLTPSPPGSMGIAGFSLPPSSGKPVDSTTGSIVLGQLGNDPPSLLSNGGNDPPSVLSNGGNDPPSVLTNTGNDPPSLLSSGGNDLPSLLSNGGNNPPGETPFTPADPAPAPAGFTLLAVGLAGLLIGLRMRRWRLA